MQALRWSIDQLKEYRQRQSRSQANDEVKSKADTQIAKYRNKKTQVDGVTFDSKLEAYRYCELKRLQDGDVIKDLMCQVPYRLEINGCLICKYIADFVYVDIDNHWVIEDVKGMRTREYQIKRKLMKAILGIEIQEYRRQKQRKQSPHFISKIRRAKVCVPG